MEHLQQPITIQNVSPDPGWFTQPVATVIAGFLAVGAAVIAYLSVLHKIRAERDQFRRNERVQLVVEAMVVTNGVFDSMTSDSRRPGSPWIEDCTVPMLKLQLFGLDKAHEAMKTVVQEFGLIKRDWEESGGDEDAVDYAKAGQALDRAMTVFKATIESIDHGGTSR